ncbi:hypothetical protein EPUS_01294 [Endocarpon pusillum Z07020]|uniref:FAD-binding domain-containing protein n=1 Tax=Endocarpon pusillum (strain Z07020 / HMAS-L-300199) TaxID=1263415 RepID=U1GU15_ENDPU|nr:uncharacterized protein EPUS_01294 [Endocarpon pusillum Z07020]ERF75928.1 hypothetical protein EPUS_01294 [Endocarpon pusillum Z07020]
MSFTPTIAIIGGEYGLTLASLLQHNHIPCTDFESNGSRDIRGQGGSLDLHAGSGLQAIVEAGLWEQFAKFMRPQGESFTPKKPETMRHELRTILLDSLEQGSVRWDSKCSKAGPAVEGKDDIHWKVTLLGEAMILLLARMVLGPSWMQIATPADRVRSDVNKIVRTGAMIASRDKQTIWAERHYDGSIQAALYLCAAETWVRDVDMDWSHQLSAKKAVVDRYLQQSNGWVEPFRQMILGGEENLIAKPLYMLPVGLSWKSRNGQVNGDAAHLMAPFAGAGVNVAMEDALILARSRETTWQHFDADGYCTDLRKCSNHIQQLTWDVWAA